MGYGAYGAAGGQTGHCYHRLVAGAAPLRQGLPVPVTPFVGRRKETGEVRRLLAASRVLTLAGPPGVGKTRLALRTAQDAARGFRDGVCVVDLGGLRDAALLAQEVAGALGLHDASTRWAVDGLTRHLGGRNILLVMDNCEHLLDACAVLLDSLVRTCGGLSVMATSRQSLSIAGETVYRVEPLSVPAEGSVRAEALELLLARAEAIQPGHPIAGGELESAAELCRRLEGVPLAIELAAVRLKTLSVDQVLERLGDRFTVLGPRHRVAPSHQRTLRAALDWSRDLTSHHEWVLWQRLSVFPTTFDLTAVEAICTGDGLGPGQVLDALDGLVDKSIVSATPARPAMRYRLLDSVREYGAEGLRDNGDQAALRRRHRDHYAGLCAEAWPNWARSEQPAWFDRLEVEHGNLRAALDWCVESQEAEAGAAMAADMWLYWGARGHLTEGRRRLGTLLESLPAPSGVRARALWVAGYLAVAQMDADAAAPLLEAGVEVGTAAGDLESVGFAMQYLGLCRLFKGDLTGAAEALEHAFDLQSHHGGQGAAFALTDLAVTVMLAGDTARAADLYEQALAMAERAGDAWTRSHGLWGAGLARWFQGDLHGAEQTEKEALRLIGALDERSGIALCLEALAWMAASGRDFERAAVLRGAAYSVWESIPGQLPEPLARHGEQCERLSRQGLGPAAWDRLFEKGQRLDRAAAVAHGLGTLGRTGRGPAGGRGDGWLSTRELEVAELVAAGLTDRGIAARLTIAPRTAESHVQHILTKLGFRSRAQIAAWVATRTGSQAVSRHRPGAVYEDQGSTS